MPYLNRERKKVLDEGDRIKLTVGDVNYLFTKYLIKLWEEERSYKKINYLRKITKHPSIDTEFWNLHQEIRLSHTVDEADIEAARDLAFYEFMRREGNDYEDERIVQNGDVYPIFQEEGDR